MYPDMDPTWYGSLYRLVPYIAETGMHSIPDAASLRELVDARRNWTSRWRACWRRVFPHSIRS